MRRLSRVALRSECKRVVVLGEIGDWARKDMLSYLQDLKKPSWWFIGDDDGGGVEEISSGLNYVPRGTVIEWDSIRFQFGGVPLTEIDVLLSGSPDGLRGLIRQGNPWLVFHPGVDERYHGWQEGVRIVGLPGFGSKDNYLALDLSAPERMRDWYLGRSYP